MSQAVAVDRYCRACGARLARDNPTSDCARCGKRSLRTMDEPPDVPNGFWSVDLIRDALASWHMGRVIAAYRAHPFHPIPLSQEVVGRWVGMTQAQISRLENGPPIKDLDRLILWARTLRIPQQLLWFRLPDRAGPTREYGHDDQSVVRVPSVHTFGAIDDDSAVIDLCIAGGLPSQHLSPGENSSSGRADRPLVEALSATLDQYVLIDNLTGPSPLLEVVPRHLPFIRRILDTSRGEDRRVLLYLAARYAEFAGWLSQDAGQLSSAMRWTDTARDLAQHAEDAQLVAYVWMRKSNIASDLRQPDLALTWANSALHSSKALTPRIRAVALRQRAHAVAMTGDADECARSLDDALDAATSADPAEPDMAQYCTPSYVEMEAANCWIELGEPQRAISALQQGLVEWQPNLRRDLGLCMARLAVAQACNDQLDQAFEAASRATGIVAETRSDRTERLLVHATSLIAARGASEPAGELRHMLTSLR